MKIQSINTMNNQKSQPNFGAYFKNNETFKRLWHNNKPSESLIKKFSKKLPNHEVEIIKTSENAYLIFNNFLGSSFHLAQSSCISIKLTDIMNKIFSNTESFFSKEPEKECKTKLYNQLTTPQK